MTHPNEGIALSDLHSFFNRATHCIYCRRKVANILLGAEYVANWNAMPDDQVACAFGADLTAVVTLESFFG